MLHRCLTRRDTDVFVSETLIQKNRLRQGALISGLAACGTAKRGAKAGLRMVELEMIEGQTPAEYRSSLPYEDRTPVNPTQWLKLERENCVAGEDLSMRVMDLLCPIGLGQRALIASPPRAGKTMLLKQIGRSISTNYPEIELVVLLIDERPEEVTEIQEEIDGQVFASSIDQTAQDHARLSRLVIDRCQRMVESGKDVVLLVDSLTRMARSFNKLPRTHGTVGAGGLSITALDVPKRIFGAARKLTEGGSLTIVASVLIETENRMDEVIFREFKGTGNMDLVLDQQIADQRIWPAVDVLQSATRRVELLHDQETMTAVTALRRLLVKMPKADAIKELSEKLKRFPSNDEFVRLINSRR